MNQDQVLGYVRTLCTVAASILGYNATQAAGLTAGLTGLTAFVFLVISVIGTWKANSVKSKLITVASNPAVSGVQLAPTAPADLKAVAATHDKIAA